MASIPARQEARRAAVIAALLNEYGVTVARLARVAGISATTMSRAVRGRRAPTSHEAALIAEYLHTTEAVLFGPERRTPGERCYRPRICQRCGSAFAPTGPHHLSCWRCAHAAACREIEDLRSRIAAPPAPMFAAQQAFVTNLVNKWRVLTADERKRMLAGIFDFVVAGAEVVVRMEVCEDWKGYLAAAVPEPVRASTERKTGLLRARCTPRVMRITDRDRIVVGPAVAA